VISGLLSTTDSNVCAVASLTSDFGGGMRAAKGSMLALLVLAIVIANIPGLAVTDLFLIYGALLLSGAICMVTAPRKGACVV